jgi:Peptidase family M28
MLRNVGTGPRGFPQGNRVVDPMNLIRELTSLPHRGATTVYERQAADRLQARLEALNADVERERFRTSKTYITHVYWIIGGLCSGLLLIPVLSWFAWGLVALSVVTALRYFDWRSTFVSLLPPPGFSENVIGRFPAKEAVDEEDRSESPKKRLILMAHYDSAPISLLYLPSMVKNFHQSLLISLGLMVAAALFALLELLGLGRPAVLWLRYVLVVYFLGQGALSSVDYFRFGFTNGAADNASGVAVAICTAERLWRNPLPGWDVEVVLTGAEETGMAGARCYYLTHREDLAEKEIFVFNFDNLGVGEVKIITKTGSLTRVSYDNPLVRAALETAAGDSRFGVIREGSWHTGDFDTVWYVRRDIPALTLSAQDDRERVPNLHRPKDTIENMDPLLPALVVDFAEATARRLARC